jgi:RNA polymerase sigma factor (sigma-70 family)
MDADDLIQEALVRTLTRHTLEELDDPLAYLRTVIVRLASNNRRTAGRRRRRALARIGRDVDEVRTSYPSDTDDLWRLEPDERAAVFLAVVEERSHREIADVLGCSEEASRKRLSRALVRLKASLVAETDNG